MKNMIRWGLAAGLAAAVGLFFDAQAQSATGSSGSSGSGSTGTSGATGSTATEKPSSRQASGMAAGQGKIDKGLQERLERLHALNQAEVQMGQLGAQSGQSPQVKEFAEHMQTDHQKADEKLTQTAQSAGAASLEGDTFRKESDKHKKEMEKIQAKTGTDFDKDFMSRMVKDHENAIKEAEKAQKDAQKAKQTELASYLQQIQTGMKGHLDHAKQVQKSVSEGGARQGRTPSAGGTGSAAPSGTSGSRGDTGGPPPTGKSGSTSDQSPQGGAAGSSSDPGRTTK